MPDADWTPLLDTLKSGDADESSEAAYLLGEAGDRRATPALLSRLRELLTTGEADVADMICRALGRLRDGRALPLLLELARGDHGMAQRGAIRALGHLGRTEAAPTLLQLLDNPIMRVAAGTALGRLGDPGLAYGTVVYVSDNLRFGLLVELGTRVKHRFSMKDFDSNEAIRRGDLVSFYAVESDRRRTTPRRIRPMERKACPQIEVDESARGQGRVRWFDSRKGYGFIRADASAEDLFVHYRDVQGDGHVVLRCRQRVRFTVARTGDGQRAVQVEPIEDP